MHVFPQLRKLEQKYAGELAVVGVHSAKFTSEKDTANLLQAVLRYDIEHPVVNDSDFKVWQRYGVRAWPTLMFIDPEGNVLGKHEGEIQFDAMDGVLSEMVAQLDSRGLIDRRPLTFRPEREKERDGPLSFPGKVLADKNSGRLIVADSNHNRIVVASFEGQVTDIVGSGKQSFDDGAFDRCSFYDPQGIALDGDTLYVADTKNHAIRAVDLADNRVRTLAGTGEQAVMFHGGGNGPSTSLNSPWDLAVHDGTLYIAMAGFHQLWRLDLATNEVRPHAGNGRERIVDGPLDHSQLAQPSGIATDGGKLYFTDSETSSVRTADLDPDGEVSTIVGLDLFTFGDVDGAGDDVRLQHPLGIDVQDGVLFITDTYNNKVKKALPDTRGVSMLLGSGIAGHTDGTASSAAFHEPGGLSVVGDTLYIADTNNHAIRVADLKDGTVETLGMEGL
jgi:DNA-binding beta-propeller fold protein YncE